jgi:hypothetical protein
MFLQFSLKWTRTHGQADDAVDVGRIQSDAHELLNGRRGCMFTGVSSCEVMSRQPTTLESESLLGLDNEEWKEWVGWYELQHHTRLIIHRPSPQPIT